MTRPPADLVEVQGIPIAPGIGVGTAHRVGSSLPIITAHLEPEGVARELTRFRDALGQSRQQLSDIQEKFEARAGSEHSYIFEAHRLMLQDPQLTVAVENRIREELETAERALSHVSDNWLELYGSFEDPFFRERASDLEEVVLRLMRNLSELREEESWQAPRDLVLVGRRLGVSSLAAFPLERIRGLIVGKTGRTSHLSIVARSYRIPVVSGLMNLRRLIQPGDRVVVDGTRGLVKIGQSHRERPFPLHQPVSRRKADPGPCRTRDGHEIHLYANLTAVERVSEAVALGAKGVGLFRSEYSLLQFLDQPQSDPGDPNLYRRLAQALGERPGIVRTLDPPESTQPLAPGTTVAGREDSLRGIRFSLKYPELFRKQVEAILIGRTAGNLQIVLPMVCSVEEVVEARQIIEEMRGRVGLSQPIPVGVMIEVPAALQMLEEIARQADFLSVGTNDLIQFLLGTDRTEDADQYLHNPLHPAVIRSLNRVQQVAAARGLRVYLCGETAAHPKSAALLVGMGFGHLSLDPVAFPELKSFLSRLSWLDLRRWASEVLQLETLKAVEAFLDKQLAECRHAEAEEKSFS